MPVLELGFRVAVFEEPGASVSVAAARTDRGLGRGVALTELSVCPLRTCDAGFRSQGMIGGSSSSSCGPIGSEAGSRMSTFAV